MSNIIKILKKVGAIVADSHFVGTSGRHFPAYVNKDALTAYTKHTSSVGKLFAEKFKSRAIDVVVAPAVGGIPLSQWTAYHLTRLKKREVLSAYTEKTLENNQVLKRGYDQLVKGKKVLVVEDLTTTGGSVKKVVESVRNAGGKVVAACVMVNRDPKLVTTKSIGVPFSSLGVFLVPSYEAKDCPLCKDNVPINTTLGHGKKYLEERLKFKYLKDMDPVGKYNDRADKVNSLLCVGIDSDFDKLPKKFLAKRYPQFEFNKWIIDQTHEYAAAFKANIAFYESRGDKGMKELKLTMDYLRKNHPDIFTICDAKRADIGNTNTGYVNAILDWLGFDAMTLHPYLGSEALEPFLSRSDKGSIILCRTSNPGAKEMQDLLVTRANGRGTIARSVWKLVAEKVSRKWNKNKNCLLVVGATYPREMKEIRKIAGDMTFLVPGIGVQGGDVAATVKAGLNSQGKGLIINSSRGIIFSGNPRLESKKLKDEINRYRI